jgi:hypothetical protein
MALRVMRYRAFGAGTPELETIGHEAAAALTETAFWRAVDAVLDTVEALAVAAADNSSQSSAGRT